MIDDSKRSECSFHRDGECGYCSDDKMVKSYVDFLNFKGIPIDSPSTEEALSGDKEKIIKKIKEVLNVKRESHIFRIPEFKTFIGMRTAEDILKTMFKPEGPSHTIDLLSNINIDDSMQQWAQRGRELFNKKFLHIPFHMIDFKKYPSEPLNHLNIRQLMDEGYSCFACVLNTDTTVGVGGKHWFCIYGDLMHAGIPDDPIVIEFFNSSGNPPMREVYEWFDKIITEAAANKTSVTYIKALPRRIQFSKTECGVWCLAYIKARLMSMTPDDFRRKVNDAMVTSYRKHIFADVM